MLDILNIAIQKSAAILTASIIGVWWPILQLQHETPVLNQTSPQILQTKFLPEVHLSMDEIATSSAKTTSGGKNPPKSSLSAVKSLPPVKLKATDKPQPVVQPKAQKTETTQPKPSPTAISSVSKISTPQDVLNATSFFLNQRIDGQYIISLHTNTGVGSGLDWGFYSDTIGGTASLPKMNTSYSCNPQWNTPPSNSSDQNPTLDLNTSYACDISVTDSLMRTATKKITFQTGAGRLLVKSSNLGTALKSGSNANGFVFDNQSDAKLTINSAVFDVYFNALNVSSPIVIRFINPDNELMYTDFPVQNLPTDASGPNAKSATGMKTSISFPINPHSQRLLNVELFGIQQLLTVGVNPEFKITLREVNTSNPGLKTTLFSPAISWSCIPFDPTHSLTGVPDEQNCK